MKYTKQLKIILILIVTMLSSEMKSQYHYFELTKKSGYFPNKASNQVAYIDLGDIQIWGWIEVTLTGSYHYQNTTGKYTKRYQIGKNTGNKHFSQSSEVPAAFGFVAKQWKLGDIERNSQNHLIIPIYHLASTGNYIYVHIKGFSVTAFDKKLFQITPPTTFQNDKTRDFVSIKNNVTIHGNVGIGTTSVDAKLTVAGNIHSREVKVTINAGADFVFENDYELPSLESIEHYIKENKHLPEITSAKEMEKEGILLGDMNIKLLQKIEELTLYTIAQEKKINSLEKLKQRVEKLEKENIPLDVIVKRLAKLKKIN